MIGYHKISQAYRKLCSENQHNYIALARKTLVLAVNALDTTQENVLFCNKPYPNGIHVCQNQQPIARNGANFDEQKDANSRMFFIKLVFHHKMERKSQESYENIRLVISHNT